MMERYRVTPEQIEIIIKETKGKSRGMVIRASLKGTGELLGWIEHRNSPVPIVNCKVALRREVLMLGHSSKSSSNLPLVGGHGGPHDFCANST